MLDYFYEWIQNIAFYLVIITAIVQVIPNNNYKKFLQFFVGIILVILLITPVLKLVGMEGTYRNLYQDGRYDQIVKGIEEKTQYLEGVNINDYISEEYREYVE
ncbi:stage III sporulation protein AF [Lachnospiraceae bacterium LCP25S3_G4]